MPITAEDLRQQREYIYQELSSRLHTTDFQLVVLVHQYSAAFAAKIPLDNFMGLCHGYNKYWRRVLLSAESLTPVITDEATLAITPQILQWQKYMLFTYTYNKFTNGTCKSCRTTTELINHLSEIIFVHIAKNKVLTLGISALPSITNQSLLAFYNMFPAYVRRSHEISICLDNNNNLHFFDCNIGWFKSNNPNITAQELNTFLTMLFDLMQYNDLRIGVLFKVYDLTIDINPKLCLTHA